MGLKRRETLDIGSSPACEDCAQVGSMGYGDRARAECAVFRMQLVREAAAAGRSPLRCALIIKTNEHDFGSYYEVAAVFDPDVDGAEEDAYWLEGNLPAKWDAEARAALGLPPEAS